MIESYINNDYYPFGMLIPNRHESSDKYRFGFNGKEKDDEVKGEGNSYDYGFRMYGSREVRFFSIDPLTKEYPMLTPYQFASNTPIWASDLDGLEADYFNENGSFIRRDMKGKPLIYIKKEGGVKLLSQTSYIESKAMRKIGRHYADQNSNISERIYIRAVESSNIAHLGRFRATDGKQYKSIDIGLLSSFYDKQPDGRVPGGTSPLIDNHYNFRSLLNHEYKHWLQYDKKVQGIWRSSISNPFNELEAIDYETSQEAWKNAGKDYHIHTVTYAGSNIAKINDPKERQKQLEYFEDKFKVKFTNLSPKQRKVTWRLNLNKSKTNKTKEKSPRYF